VTKRLVRATPIVLGHLHELGALPVLREAVTVLKGCSTSIHGGAGAANIIGHWTATTRTSSLMIRVTLIALGHLHELGPLGLKRAVSSSGSTVGGIRAAVPVGFRATASGARSLIRATLLVLGYIHEPGLFGHERTFSSSWSTEQITAGPVRLRTAPAIVTIGLIRATLPALGHLHQRDPLGHKRAVSSSGSTEIVTAEPVELWGHWAAAPRA